MDYTTLSAAAVSGLSNKELIEACKHYNITCGAINATSRGLFEKKLVAALSPKATGPARVVEEVESMFEKTPSTPLFVNESTVSNNLFTSESFNVYNDTPLPGTRTTKITKRIITNLSAKPSRSNAYSSGEEDACDGEESVRILTEAERAERRARLLSNAVSYNPTVHQTEKKSFGSTLIKLICFALFLLFAYFFYKEHMKRLEEDGNDEL